MSPDLEIRFRTMLATGLVALLASEWPWFEATFGDDRAVVVEFGVFIIGLLLGYLYDLGAYSRKQAKKEKQHEELDRNIDAHLRGRTRRGSDTYPPTDA